MFEDYFDEETRFLRGEFKNVILLILTVIDLIFIFLSISYTFSFRVENVFADYDFMVCLLIFIDLAYDYYTYEGSLKDFLIKDKNIISLISIFPFDILFRYFSIFRLFRFIKVIKLVRIWNVKKDYKSFVYFIQHHLFRLLLVILTIYVVVSAVLLIMLDGAFDSITDALWFMVVTVSTVGYGDYVPLSPIGKSLTVLTMIMGVIVVAIFTAYLSAIYNKESQIQTRGTIIKHLEKSQKGNKIVHKEIHDLDHKISDLEKENRELKEKLAKMDEKLDRINEKLE